MVIKLNAAEMRLKTEAAKTIKSTDVNSDDPPKKTEYEVDLEHAFSEQRRSILLAASEGLCEFATTRIVYLKWLLELELQVVETGKVQKKLKKVKPDPSRVASYKNALSTLLNDFLKAAKYDFSDYYGGYKEFCEINRMMLDNAIKQANYKSNYSGYDLFLDPFILLKNDLFFQIDPYHLEDHEEQLEAMNQKIKEYADYLHKIEEDSFKALDEPIEYIIGEYVFDVLDDEDYIEPSTEGNKLLIRWDSDEVLTHLNKPIFSGVGLTWLSTFKGQTLLDVLLGFIEADASEGKKKSCLTFGYNNGWYLADSEKKTFSCEPKDLQEIFVSKGFKVSIKELDGPKVKLLVSW